MLGQRDEGSVTIGHVPARIVLNARAYVSEGGREWRVRSIVLYVTLTSTVAVLASLTALTLELCR